jgi:hypothetical protein
MLFTSISFAETKLFVGVSPAIIDLGELERGTTNLVKFYVVTVSEEPFLVYMGLENGRLDFFDTQYNNFIFNFSEESTTDWIKFLNNPVELKPQNESLKTSYETIKSWREVEFLLEIPKDAEPGYHLIKVKPNPIETSGTTGRVGTNVVAITSVNVIFKVPGYAKREGVILDTVPEKNTPSQLEVNTYFQNIGTTTITAKAIQNIYDKNGNFIRAIASSKEAVKPKEIKILRSFLPLTNFSLGDYDILNSVFYTTDSTYKNSTMSITSEFLAANIQTEELPIWIFIFIIIIFAFIIYRWVH